MARGEHPRRTVAYGAVLIAAALIGSALVTGLDAPQWLRIPVYALALAAALAGSVMTLRDYS